jgi:hypothetical protein
MKLFRIVIGVAVIVLFWYAMTMLVYGQAAGVKTSSITVGGGTKVEFLGTYRDTLRATVDSVNFTVSGMTTAGRAGATFGSGAIFQPLVICRSGIVTVKSNGDEQYDFPVYLTVTAK